MLDPVELTQALIRIHSVTPAKGAVFDLVELMLKPLGFTCHRLPFGEGTDLTDNLYARLGTNGPHICFAGHLDVVPPGDESAWKSGPYAAEIRDGLLYGRGAEDMKGAIACFVAAVSAYVEESSLKGSISFLLTGDEEGDATHGTRPVLEWMKARGEIPDICLVGEPTNPQVLGEMVKIGRRGSMNTHLVVKGVQGHAAYPQLADNPVTRLVRILHELKSHQLDEGTEFFPPSNLEITTVDVGNPSSNVIPAKAEARFNIRFNDLHKPEALQQWIRSVCNKAGGEIELTMKVTGQAFLTPPGSLSELLVNAVRAVTGKVPELSTTGGTSDARFIKDYCPVIEFGTTGRTAHKVDENVAVEDLRKLAEIYRGVIAEYLR